MIKATKPTILLFFVLAFLHVQGQHYLGTVNKKLPNNKGWKELQAKYNDIPSGLLQTAEKELDPNIAAFSCYKFIPNNDTTKFISFFMLPYGSGVHQTIFKNDRGVVEYMMGDEYPLMYYCYIVWGLKHNGKWYFLKEDASAFWDTDDAVAKNHYLYFYLNYHGYFDKKEAAFWAQGGGNYLFDKSTDEPSVPRIVNEYNVKVNRNKAKEKSSKMEGIVCPIQAGLWADLQKSDPDKYIRRYTNKYMKGNTCLYVHNKDYDRVLLPIIFYDNADQCWLTYYYIVLSDKENTLYEWKKLPTRKTNEDSNQVAIDIRSFIQLWSWGASSMIDDERLWKNFTEDDITFVKKIAK